MRFSFTVNAVFVYLLMGLELPKATLHLRVDTDNIEGIGI